VRARRYQVTQVIVQIVILAMIAAFLGLRLYSVLGRRAEHEEEPTPHRFDREAGAEGPRPVPPPGQQANQPAQQQRVLTGFPPAIESGLREISAADRQFDMLAFLEGARGAYAMVLEAFWRGDREELRELCDDDVYAGFDAAITARQEAGEVLENRLIRIEDTTISHAALNGRTARIAVRFVADMAALTRDRDGAMIAGSLDDAVEIRSIWTFSRRVDSSSPAWLVDETDDG
jgi:predicted lipid-binding transport protein (Tim44 family)